MKVLVYSKGCVREEVATQKLRRDIVKSGHEKCYEISKADVIVYISCASCGDNISDGLQDIETFKYFKQETCPLIITGCLTKIPDFVNHYKDYNDIKIIKNMDFVIPILNFINNESKHNSQKSRLENRTRIFYNNTTHIQFFLCNGCLNRCSFCKTNYLKETLTSIPYEIALKYLQDMIKCGTKVITLSGENLALYGIDLYKKPVLHQFIHDLSKTPGLMYLSINEIPAQNIYPELLNELIHNEKVRSVSLQLETADNRLLDLMNRKHTIEEFDAIITPLKKAGKFVQTVLMSGFPTETYDDLDTTIRYLKDRGIATELICEYSDFAYVPSSQLEQLSKSEKAKHTAYLRNAITDVNFDVLNAKISDTNNAIVYGKNENTIYLKSFYHGYSIKKEHQNLEIGDILPTPAKRLVHEKKKRMRFNYRY